MALFLVGAGFLASCNQDHCKTLKCANGGVCVYGVCSCPTGYEDSLCGTERRAKYLGDYVGSAIYDSVRAYPFWNQNFADTASVANMMILTLKDSSGIQQARVPVTLAFSDTVTSFTINLVTTTDTFSGNGVLTPSTVSTLMYQRGTRNVMFTLSNFLRK